MKRFVQVLFYIGERIPITLFFLTLFTLGVFIIPPILLVMLLYTWAHSDETMIAIIRKHGGELLTSIGKTIQENKL